MRAAGIILLILGLAGTIGFGIRAMQNSESFQIFGMEVAVSTANWLPVIVSSAVLIVGIILMASGKKGR